MTDRLLKLYRSLPFRVKRHLTPIVLYYLAPLMLTKAAKLWFVRAAGRRGAGALIERFSGPSSEREFVRAFMLFVEPSQKLAQKAAEILLCAKETRPLAPHEYDLLVKSLLKAERREDAAGIFWELVALGRDRHRSLKKVQHEIALLAIALNEPDVAIEFSGRSGSTWLRQYVEALYRAGRSVESDALTDRRSQEADIATIRLGMLDYKSPLERTINDNLGDYIQTLAVMRNVARFYSPDGFSCDSSLKEVFDFLAESWRLQERSDAAMQVEVVIVDRDCARPTGDIWLPFFGWFGKLPNDIPMTFPLPKNVRPIFFSFHLNSIEMLTPDLCDYLKQYEPIGCRDKNTRDWLASAGVKAFFSGCVTTTLDLPDGSPHWKLPRDSTYPRSEYYRVDDTTVKSSGATALTHFIGTIHERSFTDFMKQSVDILLAYRQARGVSTTRLQCYLPCRALGTPVTFNAETEVDLRLDGLVGLDDDSLGAMRDGLTELMYETFSQILSGADAPTVYRTWRELTLPLVERDEAERAAYPRLFTRRPGNRGSKTRTDAHMEERIQIAFTFDQNLVEYVPTVIRSIEANTSERTEYHLLVRGLSGDDMRGMKKMLPGTLINWHVMDRHLQDVGYIGLNDRITISSMDLCLLPDILPHIDKILYIDVDVVVLGNVADLYRWPLGDSPLGAVQGRTQGSWLEHVLAKRYSADSIRVLRSSTSVSVPMYAPSLTSGLLLLSLDMMRRDRFTSQAVENLAKFGFDDQTLFNLYACKDFLPLSESWSVHPSRYAESEMPQLIQWAGAVKPWDWSSSSLDRGTRRIWQRYRVTNHRGDN